MYVVTKIDKIEAQVLRINLETLAVLIKDLEHLLIASNSIFSEYKIIKAEVDRELKFAVHLFWNLIEKVFTNTTSAAAFDVT